jgi:rod shape-determining protein MreC
VRNFIIFIRRFFNLILFLVLEIVCILFIARTNTLQGNDVLSSANAVSSLMYKKQNDLVYYFDLKRMNDSLVSENAKLRTRMAMYKSVDTLKDTIVRKAINPTDTLHKLRYANYIYHAARVINNSVSAANNYITINRGNADGITRGMAVVSSTGAVGKVVYTSAHFASILSVLSIKQQVSAKLKEGNFGYVVWEGGRPDVMVLKDIPQYVKVKRGDSVYTTSYSFFPSDMLIGVVTKTEAIKKNGLQLIYIQPSVNFRNLQYVYAVENTMSAERNQLEDSVKTKP